MTLQEFFQISESMQDAIRATHPNLLEDDIESLLIQHRGDRVVLLHGYRQVTIDTDLCRIKDDNQPIFTTARSPQENAELFIQLVAAERSDVIDLFIPF